MRTYDIPEGVEVRIDPVSPSERVVLVWTEAVDAAYPSVGDVFSERANGRMTGARYKVASLREATEDDVRASSAYPARLCYVACVRTPPSPDSCH